MTVVTLVAFVLQLAGLSVVLTTTCQSQDQCQSRPFVASTFHVSRAPASQVAWPVSLVGAGDERVEMVCLRVADVEPRCTAAEGGYEKCLQTNKPIFWAAVKGCGTEYRDHPAVEFLSCVDEGRNFTRGRVNAFLRCARERLWSLHEVPLGVDSAVFLGAYNWPVVLLAGYGIYMAFCVYAGLPVLLTVSDYFLKGSGAEPSDKNFAYEIGAILASVWCLSLFVVNMLLVFNEPTKFKENHFPTTTSTALTALVAYVLAAMYFVNRALAGVASLSEGGSLSTRPVIKVDLLRPAAQRRGPRLGVPFPRVRLGAGTPGAKAEDKTEVPSSSSATRPPLHLYAASSVCDGLLVAGILGVERDLQTSIVWSVFWLVLYTRACGLVVAEQIEDPEPSDAAEEEGEAGGKLLRVCTLSAEFALALACVLTLSLSGYNVALIFFVLTTFFEMLLQFVNLTSVPSEMFSWMCWMIGVILRTGFLVVCLLGPLSQLSGLQRDWDLLHRAFQEYGVNTFARTGHALVL